MADTGHTPGPWNVRPRDDGNTDIGTANGSVVAMLLQPRVWETESRSEIPGNARLIASAPDLLAALRDIEQMPHAQRCAYHVQTTDVRAGRIDCTCHVLVARAAIAKAEGRGA